jgi:hypothetical protein
MSATDDFNKGVEEVKLLESLVPVSDPDLPPGVERIDAVNAVMRSCVVLLVSHFEGFLRGLAEEFVDAISTGHIDARRLPVALRELHTIPKLVEISRSTSPEQRIALLKKMGGYAALWNDDAKPPPGTLDAALVTRQIANAGSRRIDALFTVLGSSDLVCDGDIDIDYSDIGDELQTLKIRTALQDVVECRNDIAHGDVERKPTPTDLDRYIRFLSALSQRLSRKKDGLLAIVLS